MTEGVGQMLSNPKKYFRRILNAKTLKNTGELTDYDGAA